MRDELSPVDKMKINLSHHFGYLIDVMSINVAAIFDFLVAETSCCCHHNETAILSPVSCGWEASNENDSFKCSIDGLVDNSLHGPD